LTAPPLRGGSLRTVGVASPRSGTSAFGQFTRYVNGRTGCDSLNGQSPATAYQSITRALQEAATNLSVPWTIMVAGVLDPASTYTNLIYIVYDDVAGPHPDPCTLAPAPAECLPLPMLKEVSLVWDVANSDPFPAPPPPAVPVDTPARPIIRGTVGQMSGTLGPLLRFTNTPPNCTGITVPYSPGPTVVSLEGLRFEGGNPAIDILDNPSGVVQPSLLDLQFDQGRRAISVIATTGQINPQVTRCFFLLAPVGGTIPPGVNPPVLEFVFLQPTGASSGIGGQFNQCTFKVVDTPTINLKVNNAIVANPSGGTISTLFTNSLFEGSDAYGITSGLGIGIEFVFLLSPAPANTSQFTSTVSGSTFRKCLNAGVAILANASLGTTASNASALTISGCQFYESGTTLAPGTPGGQILLDIGAGQRITTTVSGNSFFASPLSGIFLRNQTPHLSGNVPGLLSLDISQNDIRYQGGDGIHLEAIEVVVSGPLSRNKIFDNGGDGIENYAFVPPGGFIESTSIPDIVNNMVGHNGGDGINNHSASSNPTVKAAAAPRITHDTIALNLGWGLNNPSGDVFKIWNSVFDGNALGDMNIPPGFEVNNVFWTRFGTASATGPPNNNTTLPPGLINPAHPVHDFRLMLTPTPSYMIDMASLRPPALPAVDHFGNPRQVEHIGIGNDGANFADKGAHEVQ